MKLWDYEDLVEMLNIYISKAPIRVKYLRLNEAGDFPDQKSVDTWNRISIYLREQYGIKTYCYTCRNDLDFSNVNFAVNASRLDIEAKRHYLCIDKDKFEKLPSNVVKCCGDCNKCKLCYDSNYEGIIFVKKH